MKKRSLTSFTRIIGLCLILALMTASLSACTDDNASGGANTTLTKAAEPDSPISENASGENSDKADDFSSSAPTVNTPTASGSFNANREITVVSREEGSGTRGAFIELFGIEVRVEGAKIDMTTEEAVIINSTNVVLTTVAEDPYAIGYVSIGSLNGSVNALSIDGIPASSENVKKGSYTIYRPFNIAVKDDISDVTADFIAYILSAEGQAVASGSYVAINSEAEPYSGSKPSGKITVGGSSSVGPLMEKLIEAYSVINPNATIELLITDSSAGMNGAIEGTIDIGMASRALSENEYSSLESYVIALDGVAVIVNKDNPLNDLSKEEVRQIFTGELTQWDGIID